MKKNLTKNKFLSKPTARLLRISRHLESNAKETLITKSMGPGKEFSIKKLETNSAAWNSRKKNQMILSKFSRTTSFPVMQTALSISFLLELPPKWKKRVWSDEDLATAQIASFSK